MKGEIPPTGSSASTAPPTANEGNQGILYYFDITGNACVPCPTTGCTGMIKFVQK
jgi:hypothetical protein